MLLSEVNTILQTRLIKVTENENEEMIDTINNLLSKLPNVPESAFTNCNSFNDILITIEMYKPKRTKTATTNTKKTYYLLTEPIANTSDKAIGIVVGENFKHGSNRREYIEWIALSQIIKENDKVYIPAWIVKSKSMYHVVNKDCKIVR